MYEGKCITYWYFWSQSKILTAKPRKYDNPPKHRDTPSVERFNCDGVIKITIKKTNSKYQRIY